MEKDASQLKDWLSKFQKAVRLVKDMPRELQILNHAITVDKTIVTEEIKVQANSIALKINKLVNKSLEM